MIRLAMIGDIGSGKSYIGKLFGYPVFNADLEVIKLYKTNRECFKKLKKILPDFITSFPIKKKELAQAIAKNKNNLKKINKIVHPEIRYQMNAFTKRYNKKKFIVLDVPLLMENNINKKNDILIFVDAKKKEINKRLKKRNNSNHKILRKFQLPVEIKKRKANFIIKNNFKSGFVKKNVKLLKNILLND